MNEIVEDLYKHYLSITPSASTIAALTSNTTLDHLALRTINVENCSIDVLMKPLIEQGYEQKGTYHFKDKHLDARHYELEGSPKIFVSELRIDELSQTSRDALYNMTRWAEAQLLTAPKWGITYPAYLELAEESEYAAWFAVHGWMANHFALLIEDRPLSEFNTLVTDQGFTMNESGGTVIKGSPETLLEQSSTMADPAEVMLYGNKFKVPGCFCEFVVRHLDPYTGKPYSGFLEKNANDIFDSTNMIRNKG